MIALSTAGSLKQSIDLQVNVSIRNYETKEARVVGLGLRTNTENLNALLKKS
jgi:hypothetical protein